MTKKDILIIIAMHTREVVAGLDEHDFSASDRLVDLGANSIDRAEIAMLAQETLALSISRTDLFGPTNIGELADLFFLKLNAA